jgi:hypothetical protein
VQLDHRDRKDLPELMVLMVLTEQLDRKDHRVIPRLTLPQTLLKIQPLV